ncbi:MAG TPA: response regulator transcription factor [Geopsychrobacteraceae bacterium]|nr:response regulator transcription factor [Geopsychrobacteraceae bacterium]
MNRILVIDDDLELCELLAEYLTPEGFEVETVNDGEHGAGRATSEEHALVILDVMLPKMNGFDVLRKIREHSRIPVIMLTARGDDIDRIVGLEMGADDYLPKPFNPRELVARIRAIQRRAETAEEHGSKTAGLEQMEIGDLLLKSSSREVFRHGAEIDLTSVEFSLLEALLQRAGQVIPREDLVKQVLGRRLSPYDRSIDVHISSLRKKLGTRAEGGERIKTVRGVGYLYILSEVG